MHTCKGDNNFSYLLRLLAPSQIILFFSFHLEIIYLYQITCSDCCRNYVSMVSTGDLLKVALSRQVKKQLSHVLFVKGLVWEKNHSSPIPSFF